MKVLRFSGPSNTGKTTLICELTTLLANQGLCVAFLKHSHHTLPDSNKDTDRSLKSGAKYSLLATANAVQMTTVLDQQTPLELLARLCPTADAVLVEGWRAYDLPTILMCSAPPPREWLFPKNIVGCVGWSPSPQIPIFDSAKTIAKVFFTGHTAVPKDSSC